MSLYYLSKDYITNNIFETKNNNKTVKTMLLNSSWIQYTFIQRMPNEHVLNRSRIDLVVLI
jgi:hypothetical protein